VRQPNEVDVWRSRVIWLAATLSVADAVNERPRTAAEIAHDIGAHAGHLERVMKALVSVGVFTLGPGGYAHTPWSLQLHSEERGGQRRRFAASMGGAGTREAALAEAVLTGGVAFEIHHGMNWVEYFTRHPDHGAAFRAAMAAETAGFEADALAAHRFAPFRVAVDLGGAHGDLLIALLKLHPNARGIVLDLPDTIEAGRPHWGGHGRIDGVAGDFFKAVPSADLYLIKSVLHDWTDAHCVAILSTVRRAIEPDGRVAIIEVLLPETPIVGHPGHLMDINMLAMTGGRERTAAEYQALFTQAGFATTRVSPSASAVGVVEARTA
jgi:O-methyltransferase domain